MKINLNNNKKPSTSLGNKTPTKIEHTDDDRIVLDPFAGQTKKSTPRRNLNLDKDPVNPDKPKSRRELKREAKEKKIKEVQEKVAPTEKKPLRERNIFKKKEKDTSALTPEPQQIINKEGLRPGNRKLLSIIGLVVGFILIFILATQFLNAMRQIREGTYLGVQQVMMPNVTGYTEEKAIEVLDKEDIHVTIEYMYDKFSPDGTVIKCSVDPDNPVEKGTTIKLYVCKNPNQGDVPVGQHIFDDLILPRCPSDKDSVSLVAVSVDDTYLNLKFQSKSGKTIKAIRYTLGLIDINGKKLNMTYEIENLDLALGQTVVDKIELTDPNLVEITFEYLEALKVKQN